MSDIKVIKNLKPWEVMRRAGEGEPVAAVYLGSTEGALREEDCDVKMDWSAFIYYIIDTTTPEIEWDKFDWDFFKRSGFSGLPVTYENITDCIGSPPAYPDICELRESPFYYWPGGEQPVPDDAGIKVVLRNGSTHEGSASMWAKAWGDGATNPSEISCNKDKDIISFKLTGKHYE